MNTSPLPVPPPPEGYILNAPASSPPPAPDVPPPPDGYILNKPAAPVGPVEDIGRGAVSGLANGVAGIHGAAGDAQTLLQKYNPFDYLARKFEEAYPETAKANRALADKMHRTSDVGEIRLPTTAQIKSATGADALDYEPTTVGGHFVKTAGEFAPGAMVGPMRSVADIAGNLARYGVAPAVASETAGQLTKGTTVEPWARAGAAILTPAIGPRMITPFPAEGQRAAHAATLADEGVTALTAGQRTGSAGLTRAENFAANVPFSGRNVEDMNDLAARQFTNAALRRVGEAGPVDAPRLATPEVIDGAFRRIGSNLDDLAARNRMEGTRALGDDLSNVEREYHALVPESARAPIIADTIREIGEGIANNGGSLPGETYSALRSRLARAARSSNDPQLSHALSDLTEAVDDAMSRSVRANSPADTGAFEQARRQYRNLLVLERASTAAGADAAHGIITPSNLFGAAKAVQGRRALARGQGDFADLTRAGQTTLRPLENKPGGFDLMHHLQLTGLLTGGAAATGAGALAGHAIGGAAAALAPVVAARGLLSRPVQWWASNQAIGRQSPLRDTSQGQVTILRGLLDAANGGDQ
jgi:hypothetical protein